LLLVDVNNFKTINDSYGHQLGDDVLVAVARQLTQQVRASDWLARIGGDEFAILLRDTDSAEAHQVADKLLETPFIVTGAQTHGSNPQLTIRFAVGVATLNTDIDSVRQWLEAADQRMYRHKRFSNLRLHSVD
jgi:diguanylate cyclase